MKPTVRQLIKITSMLTMAMLSDASFASQSYNDGQLHVITSTINADVVVSNNTDVIVQSPGWIRATTSGQDKVGAHVRDTSSVWVASGDLTSTTSGPGDATGIQAHGSATIVLSGGEVRGTTSEPGSAFGVILNGSSMLEITGGSIWAITNGALARGITAHDQSMVRIAGGEITTIAFSSPIDYDLVANGASRFTIIGSDFNYPVGIPIPDLTGQITGRLADGGFFSYSFQRSASASIVLGVPEPSSAALMTIVGIVMSSLRGAQIRSRK